MAVDDSDYELVSDNLYRSKSNPSKFLFRFVYLGKKHRKVFVSKGVAKTKRDQEREARIALDNYKEAAMSESLPDDTVTVNKLFDMYMELQPHSKWSLQKRHSYARYIENEIGKMKATSIKPLHIQRIISKIEKQLGLSSRSQKLVLEILRPLFKFGRQNGIVKNIPTEDIRVKMTSSKKFITSPTEKLIHIYRGIREYYVNDPFYQAFFLLGFSGRRKGEIINLKWENINFEHGTYWLEADVTKPRQNQQYRLSPAIQELLLMFREKRGYVFASPLTGNKIVNIQKQVEKLKKHLDMPEFGMHMMRNVLVSAMAEQGVESVLLSGALGHTDATTINKYLSMPHLKGSEVANDVISGLV